MQASLASIVRDSRLNTVMIDAAVRGSIGSVAILMRVLEGRVFFQVLDSIYLTPVWDPKEPDTLLSVVERYKVTGTQLAANGYDTISPQTDYWFQRSWDSDLEVWCQTIADQDPELHRESTRSERSDMGSGLCRLSGSRIFQGIQQPATLMTVHARSGLP